MLYYINIINIKFMTTNKKHSYFFLCSFIVLAFVITSGCVVSNPSPDEQIAGEEIITGQTVEQDVKVDQVVSSPTVEILVISTSTADIQIIKDVEYAKVDDKSLLLDIYSPKIISGTKKLPVILWIHGNRWRSGTKEQCPVSQSLPVEGFIVISINYRLSGEALFPAQIYDIKAAVRWIKANAGKYNFDADKVIAMGNSAGGHLVAMLGTTGDVKELEGTVGGNLEYSSRVSSVVDLFGPTNFITMQSECKIKGCSMLPTEQLLGCKVLQCPDKARQASPITYVTDDDPPFLILHGDKDPLIPPAQSAELNNKLKSAGVDSNLIVAKGFGHDTKMIETYFSDILKFLTAHR